MKFKSANQSFLVLVPFCVGALIWLGCEPGKGKVEHDSIEPAEGAIEQLSASEPDVGVATAAAKADSTATQLLTASENDETIKGSQIAIPPGALSFDTNLTIESGEDIANDSVLAELGLSDSNDLEGFGFPVIVDSDTEQDLAIPMTLSLPLPAGSSLTQSDLDRLVVIYRIRKVGLDQVVSGLIPRSELRITEGGVEFETSHFGTFQLGLTEVLVEERKEETSTAPILSKRSANELPEAAIDGVALTIGDDRSALVVITVSGMEDASCILRLDRDKMLAFDFVGPIEGLSHGPVDAFSEDEHDLYARASCTDRHGRTRRSAWTDAVNVAAVETPDPPAPPPPAGPTGPDQPATITIDNATPGQLDLQWTSGGSESGFLVLSAPTATTVTPTDGTAYAAGNTIAGSTVIHVGSGLAASDFDIPKNTTKYYQVFAYDADLTYSTSRDGSGITLSVYPAAVVAGQANDFENHRKVFGMYKPKQIVIAGGKTVVADTDNHRVLIWNSPLTSYNQRPDIVLGQPDLNHADAPTSASATNLNTPSGVATDGSTFVAVADTMHNRVLVWTTFPTAHGQAANFVIGQTSMTFTADGCGTTGLDTPSSLHWDGTNLYIGDYQNNRVVIHNALPTANNRTHDVVVGQPNPATCTQGTSATKMYRPTGIATAGSKLLVSEKNSHRVLVFNTIPLSDGAAADVVMGQANFTAASANAGGSTGQSTLNEPMGVFSDGTAVYVGDTQNHRFLRWDSVPTSDNTPADAVLCQPNFTSNARGVSNSMCDEPRTIASDGTRLYGVDLLNDRIIGWNSTNPASSAPADFLYGHARFDNPGINSSKVEHVISNASAVTFTSDGKMIVVDWLQSRVLIWNEVPLNDSFSSPDIALGQPDITQNHPNRNTLNPISGVAANTLWLPRDVWTDGTRLAVSDSFNRRVLIWNTFPTTSGQAADVVLGQPNFALRNTGATATGMNAPRGIFFDGTNFFVADSGNNRVLMWTSFPSSNGQAADYVLGQASFGPTGATNTQSGLASPHDVYSDGTNILVADHDNHRVMMWTAIPATNGENATYVVGQTGFGLDSPNSGSSVSGSGFDSPRGVTVHAGRMYVTDTKNNRILYFDNLPAANNPASDGQIGQASPTANLPNPGGQSASTFWSPARMDFYDDDLYVADLDNDRIVRQPVP